MPDGIELQAVERFLDGRLPGFAGPLTAELIAGGRSNLTYRLDAPSGSWVLRRPPLGHVLPTAHDMGREFRILSALADSDVPVPRPVALCTDTDVIGAPFYVMQHCTGIVVRESLPEGFAATAAERRRISARLVDTLARLHAIDWQAAGLADFGRPEGFLARQVRRWGEQWDRSKTRELPALDRLRQRLAATVPQSPPPAIVHGDFRLENVMLDAHDPARIVAVFDWEMATIGDPLADLGWTLALWPETADPAARLAAFTPITPTTAPGFFSRDEFAAAYADRTGRALHHLPFYTVFGLFKLAVIYEGIHARYLAGETRGDGFERFGVQVPLAVAIASEVAVRL